jgi:sugar phosphate isomerase/epimerase
MLRQLGKRVRMLHLKDRKAGFAPSTELNSAAEHFTPLGEGSIDWKAVLAEAEKIGVEHWFVEQDETEGPPLKALATSYSNLKKLIS